MPLHRMSEHPVGFEDAPGEDTSSTSLRFSNTSHLQRLMQRLSTWPPVDCEASATPSPGATQPLSAISWPCATGEFGPRRVIRLARCPASGAATYPHTHTRVSILKRHRARPCTMRSPTSAHFAPQAGRSQHPSANLWQSISRATYPVCARYNRPDICTTSLSPAETSTPSPTYLGLVDKTNGPSN
jgi:hypothetical protein